MKQRCWISVFEQIRLTVCLENANTDEWWKVPVALGCIWGLLECHSANQIWGQEL